MIDLSPEVLDKKAEGVTKKTLARSSSPEGDYGRDRARGVTKMAIAFRRLWVWVLPHGEHADQSKKRGTFSDKAAEAKEEFFEFKKNNPDPPKELTPLQRRMQSGGA